MAVIEKRELQEDGHYMVSFYDEEDKLVYRWSENKNGKKDGEEVQYFTGTDRIKHRINWKNGQKDGVEEIYEPVDVIDNVNRKRRGYDRFMYKTTQHFKLKEVNEFKYGTLITCEKYEYPPMVSTAEERNGYLFTGNRIYFELDDHTKEIIRGTALVKKLDFDLKEIFNPVIVRDGLTNQIKQISFDEERYSGGDGFGGTNFCYREAYNMNFKNEKEYNGHCKIDGHSDYRCSYDFNQGVLEGRFNDGHSDIYYASNGNYKLYAILDPSRIIEEGTKGRWTKRYPNKFEEILPSGDYKKYNVFVGNRYIEEEGNINGKYTCYDENQNVIETGDYQTKKYQKFNKDHRLLEEGYLEKLDKGWRRSAESKYKYDKLGDIIEKQKCIKQEDFKEIREEIKLSGLLMAIDSKDEDYTNVLKGWATYKPKANGSGLYLCEVGGCTFDELGRIKSGNGKTYTYHGNTDVVATQEKEGVLTTYDEKSRIIKEQSDPRHYTEYHYYGGSNNIEFSKQIIDGKVWRVKHFNQDGVEDTVAYLAREHVAKRKEEKLAKLEGKPKIKRVAEKVFGSKALNDLDVKIAARRIKKSRGE